MIYYCCSRRKGEIIGRKVLIILVCALVFSFFTTAYATTPDDVSPLAFRMIPQISFEGERATCTAIVFGDNMNDELFVTLKLWQGNTCIATWSTSGTGHLQFTRTKTVTRGVQYKLTLDVTINGVKEPTASVLGTCK